MRVLIDPGIMPVDQMIDLRRRALNDVRFITDKVVLKAEYARRDGGCRVDIYPKVLSREPLCQDCQSLRADPVRIWRKLIDDHQTFLLYDRTIRIPLSNSLKVARIIDHALRIQSYLENCKPDILVFMATPHDIGRWLFARVAEELGVRVLYFQETLLPWRFALMEGLRRDALLLRPRQSMKGAGEAALAADYERQKRGSFANAFPKYERDRLSSNRGRYYNFFRDLRRSWRRPDLLLNKALCFRAYRELSQAPSDAERFVAFFLHFQPERTTLPESYGFAQQLASIVALAAVLPPGLHLCVKEHPSIYTADCQWDERLPFWYRKIAQTPGVRLLPIETDPYTLIDRSDCVATIAGTIGGEALIRGKPVVAFGRGALSLARTPALHKYTDQESLRAFLADLERLRETGFTLEQYCEDIAEETYSGAGDEANFGPIEERLDDVRYAALAAAFAELMAVPSHAKSDSAASSSGGPLAT
jgi:hypothetical protein